MVIRKVFDCYKKALDFCYLHNISVEKIENHSSPKDLVWKYLVEYKKRR